MSVMNRNGFAPIVLLLIATGILAVGAYMYSRPTAPSDDACTAEAKQCPDGSYVGRTGPNCEFAECPVTVPNNVEAQYSQFLDEFRTFATEQGVGGVSVALRQCAKNNDIVLYIVSGVVIEIRSEAVYYDSQGKELSHVRGNWGPTDLYRIISENKPIDTSQYICTTLKSFK